VDGTERGQIAKVCADPTCPVHFADRHTANPEQVAKEREQRRKELERQKLEATVRHRTLAEVLRQIGAPLDRAGLALVASGLLNKLEPMRQEVLARRHKLIEKTNDKAAHPQVKQAIAKLVRQADEAALSKLLIEATLLEIVDQTPQGDADVLTATAKRLRVDMVKVRKTVVDEFAARRAKQESKQNSAAKKSTAKSVA
jgi:ParB family chromosome partitioning protein